MCEVCTLSAQCDDDANRGKDQRASVVVVCFCTILGRVGVSLFSTICLPVARGVRYVEQSAYN